jgi:hypothetical protein
MRNPSNPYHNQGYGNGYYNNQIDSPISAHSQHHSYDNMTSGSDENTNGKSTNPSSLNSSFDHLHQMQMRQKQQEYDQYNNDINFAPVSAPHQQLHQHFNQNQNAYGANGNTQVRDYDPYGNNTGNGYGGGAPPRPPAKDGYGASGSGYGGSGFSQGVNNPRVPIKLNGPSEQPRVEEKRKSWIKRTFSRRN